MMRERSTDGGHAEGGDRLRGRPGRARAADRRRAQGPAQAGREGRLARRRHRGRHPRRLRRQGRLPEDRFRRAKGRLLRARTALGLAGVATLGAALWWRKNPSACPYGQRFWVEAPHPVITRERLRSVLAPQPGERLLEIGPGTGYYTLDLAEWIGPDGRVEIFDLQQEFLDHVGRLAAERGLENVVPTQGDATALPY